MKISPAILFAIASADDTLPPPDRKVPPRHPLQRLARLNQFTEELLTQWFDCLPSQQAWINKFKANGARMVRNFERGNQRCGFYDENQFPHGGPNPARKRRDEDSVERYNRDDPTIGVKQLTTGYRKWAERYLSQCSGQKQYKHQINRMNKWNVKLQAHLQNMPDCRTGTGTTSAPAIGKFFCNTSKLSSLSDCVDLNGSCAYWASIGECEANPGYMLRNCKKSCNVCGVDVEELIPTASSACIDQIIHCPTWAAMGQCESNPVWMNDFCKISCNSC